MKKILVFCTLMTALYSSTASAKMSYDCYFDGTGFSFFKGWYVTVSADSKSEAEILAIERLKENHGNDIKLSKLECKN